MKKEKEKRPIYLPCGTEVKEGLKVYKIYSKDVSSYQRINSIKPHSGGIAHYLIEYVVAHVNHAENSRSFILRSDRGCESTYSVKNNCLSELYGNLKKANKILAKKEKEIHVRKIEEKIKRKIRDIKTTKEVIKRFEKTKKEILKNLSKLK